MCVPAFLQTGFSEMFEMSSLPETSKPVITQSLSHGHLPFSVVLQILWGVTASDLTAEQDSGPAGFGAAVT